MDLREFKNSLFRDIATELTDEFDRNFERKAFFTDRWPAVRLVTPRGSLLVRSGALRRSIQGPKVGNGEIRWASSAPQAQLLNEGGEIVVTEKMKRFFWAMYYKVGGAVKATAKGRTSYSKRNVALRTEAIQWRSLALMKVGQKMKIEKRQFIGDHPQARKAIENVIDDKMKELEIMVYNELKKKK